MRVRVLAGLEVEAAGLAGALAAADAVGFVAVVDREAGLAAAEAGRVVAAGLAVLVDAAARLAAAAADGGTVARTAVRVRASDEAVDPAGVLERGDAATEGVFPRAGVREPADNAGLDSPVVDVEAGLAGVLGAVGFGIGGSLERDAGPAVVD